MRREEILFLRTFDAVAECLRGFKQIALEAANRSETNLDISTERMWNSSHDSAFEAAGMVEAPSQARAAAADLLKRLKVWKDLARGAREMKVPGLSFHVQEIWELSDEHALLRYEKVRAGMIGDQELPFMVAAI